ncbi:hypothetical protein KIW84_032627 [Lathyrus oleraceus]|uniref:Reverse transcriptase/retrotransposon-derived protein RNase H-like domain-containing protein n=1 Tax=Pisum sativum TaxID=3888 RepID=A0A9D5AWV3_PEA|nr:hypothetical protein KIW84_032627 [Pisum sativum]
MRQSGVVVKAFDGSRAVTSTLHQKLKFIKNKKLVVIGGEKALLVSHLSSFSYIDAEDEVGTPFQALSIAEPSRKGLSSFVSYNDTKLAIEHGATNGMGKMIKMEDNKSQTGIGYSSGVSNDLGPFQSGGFIHTVEDQEAAAIIEEDEVEDLGNFVIPGRICNNWVVVDVPTVIHKSALTKPIEHNDPTPSPNFEFPVFEVEEDDVEKIPDEITRLLEHEEKIIQPHLKNLEIVNLGSEDCIREVKIGALLEESVKKGLIELLREYVDVFAWSYEDMPGLDTDIVQHFLPLKPECVLVKQKLRRTHPNMAVKIKEEVQKQIDAGFLVTSTYPQWVVNIVPVPKKDGKIKMAPEDMEKTTFVTSWGTLCYRVMPFGLKNVGATYQRAMTTLFHDMMHKEIERLRKYKLHLNPNKCTFGVRSGKLLGFIVSEKGIEFDPAKVKVIQEMPAPKTEKQVRGFLGRLNYISRFISHMAAICAPIFKLLRKNQRHDWTKDCPKAFDIIKEYLPEPLILSPPVEGRPLIMYLTVLDDSMGCVLGQQDESGKKEYAIYYLSKKFTDCESQYSMLEKT